MSHNMNGPLASMKRTVSLLLFVCALLLAPNALLAGQGNTTNDSYNQSKRTLERQVYYDHRVTIYCGAAFDASKNVTLPSGFMTPKYAGRSARIEWEHVVPAENFGRTFAEWREGDPQCVSQGKPFKGRRCAEKVNMEYRYMQADMYNLYPAIGSVNALRSNMNFAMLGAGVPSAFGTCEMKISGNRVEPPARARGQIARTYKYMADAYAPRNRTSRQQSQLMDAWDREYPVDVWECTRAKRIEALQGNANRFVKDPCIRAGLW